MRIFARPKKTHKPRTRCIFFWNWYNKRAFTFSCFFTRWHQIEIFLKYVLDLFFLTQPLCWPLGVLSSQNGWCVAMRPLQFCKEQKREVAFSLTLCIKSIFFSSTKRIKMSHHYDVGVSMRLHFHKILLNFFQVVVPMPSLISKSILSINVLIHFIMFQIVKNEFG